MVTTIHEKKIQKSNWNVFAVSSILITLFLFFIDEGYYNFNWMANIGNWIAFLIYVVPVFLFQLLIYAVALRRYPGRGKIWMSIVFGTAMALMLVIGIILANS